jgi:hypothetical protein
MKILVDADYLHTVFMKVIELKRDNKDPKTQETLDYVSGSLGSMWFQGTQEIISDNKDPDPRCNGCKYQHPFKENIEIDWLNNRVLCHRNINPPFLRDGKYVYFEEGHSLMICPAYKYTEEHGLITVASPPRDEPKYEEISKSQTDAKVVITNYKTNPLTQEWIPIEKPYDESNRQAIIEILGMLTEHADYHITAQGLESKVFRIPMKTKAEELKTKLVGEE